MKLLQQNVGSQVSFVIMAIFQLLLAHFTDQASFRRTTTSSIFTSSADTLKLDLSELRKLGVGREDLLRHIRLLVEGRHGRLEECLARVGAGSGDSAAGEVPLPAVKNSAATTGPGRDELHRQFVLNKTVTCNDGSKAGYVKPDL